MSSSTCVIGGKLWRPGGKGWATPRSDFGSNPISSERIPTLAPQRLREFGPARPSSGSTTESSCVRSLERLPGHVSRSAKPQMAR